METLVTYHLDKDHSDILPNSEYNEKTSDTRENEENNEYQKVPEQSKASKESQNDLKDPFLEEPKKITSAKPPQTGEIVVKKVRFVEKPEVFLVESYKKYNQVDYKENCCDCSVF